ncbi:DEKNAAC104123 [Brettanomyces naardenensis]|uniref:3-hydroxyisobutyryl-CoA hydrolase n=1 Tax=Brettanomyces naardenensis TaxID=13370 RepID=A0A448YPP9_BRENA|nr:DEKNAAC104123 [Brettanomyces naardenensis]
MLLSRRIVPASMRASSRLSLFLRQMATAELSGATAAGATTTSTSGKVSFQVNGTARIISLNRPSKLNALDTDMCSEMIPRLVEFNKSKSNNLIILKSLSPRAFCAGGDVVQCAKDNLAGHSEKATDFFDKEYNLDYLLAVYGKPIVSLVNGIAMGGGVGLSVHGPFRVVCETTRIAMPETRIGFFDDVGTSFWLPKLDGNLGFYLSLTGDDLRGFDTLLAGFGTHYVPSERFDDLTERLSYLELENLSAERRREIFSNPDEFYALVSEAIEEFTEDVPEDHVYKFTKEQLNTIEKSFNPKTHKSVEQIIDDLLLDGSDFALKTAKTLQSKSPISLKLNWELLVKGMNSTIHEALSRELKVAGKLMTAYKPNDFNIAISARLIEKIPDSEKIEYVINDLASVPASLIDNLSSLDVFNPDVLEGEVAEDKVKSLEKLKISQFEECPNLIQNYQKYPYEMGLPSEKEIGKYVKGEDDSNRQFSVTTKEAIKYFQRRYKNKNGVTFKVKQVLDRKTKGSEYGKEYLDWVA